MTYAIRKSNELNLPLIVYEGLKYYYPWANDRLHTFILEGVQEKRNEFELRGIRYIFYLQQDGTSPRSTLSDLSRNAACIVTDDYPCFIIPEHNRRIAELANIPVYAVDSNGVLPMSKFRTEEYAAYTIRPKIKKLLPEYLRPFVDEKVKIDSLNLQVDCPETIVDAGNISSLVSECDIDHSVNPSLLYKGGTSNGRKRLARFVSEILPNYESTETSPSSTVLHDYLHIFTSDSFRPSR